MSEVVKPWLGVLLFILFPNGLSAGDSRFAMELGLEGRGFFEQGLFGNEDRSEVNLRIRPDYSFSWDQSRKVFQFEPYLLWSDPDDEKTHADIRELSFTGTWDRMELRVGVSKVFWGVTESVHLTDVINQTDLVENFDGEDKLGQPMIQWGYATRLGQFSAWVLPFFRERTFPGFAGRLRTPLVVDTDRPFFEARRGKYHLDGAVRWEQTRAFFDIGLSYFLGTSRDPILKPFVEPAGQTVFIPHYFQIRQTGLDLQVTLGRLLLKHESVYRDYRRADVPDFFTQATGFEYSFYNLGGSQMDVGVLAEYLYADEATNALNIFDRDLFTGVRIALNDLRGTELLAGMIFDLDQSQRVLSLEAKRRLSTSVAASLEWRYFDTEQGDLVTFDRESFGQLEITYHF